MRLKYTRLDDRLYTYLLAQRSPEDRLLAELREETSRLGDPAVMQISPEQGDLLTLLVAAIGARRAIEVGSFTGMSGLCIARGLGPDGRLLCCDVSEEWTRIARRYWERAGVAERIELRLGPAGKTLAALPSEPAFDFAFLDADKSGYGGYYEALLPRLRRNGLIVVDNVLWEGKVVRADALDADTRAIREFNGRVASDPRVQAVTIAVADGLMLVRKL